MSKINKSELIQLCLQSGTLKFGEFPLKSGRLSPYFFLASELFKSGKILKQLGECYAQAIEDAQMSFDVLFGPAYKGIPVVASTAVAYANSFDRDIAYSFNRKESKAYGEGGSIIGTALKGRVVVLDDVLTAGTAFRDSVKFIQGAGAEVAGLVVLFDRQEKGLGEKSAIQEIEEQHGIPVVRLMGLSDLIDYIHNNESYRQHLPALEAYRQKYGI